MIYMFLSTILSAAVVAIGLRRRRDPRMGLLLAGSLCFLDLQLMVAHNPPPHLLEYALTLTLLTILETGQRYRNL